LDATPQHSPCGRGKFGGCPRAGFDRFHFLQDLQQSPAAPLIALGWIQSFPFEIHVVDQRVNSLWGGGHGVILSLEAGSPGGRSRGQQLWEGAASSLRCEFGLQTDRTRQVRAQAVQAWAVLIREKIFAGAPGAGSGGGDPRGWRGASRAQVRHHGRKTFLKRLTHTAGVPDKMANTQAGEIFAFIP
jgi:hypothetical protein